MKQFKSIINTSQDFEKRIRKDKKRSKSMTQMLSNFWKRIRAELTLEQDRQAFLDKLSKNGRRTCQ
ncbi:hypothetical protein BKL86_14310 [Staphylococcus aureus]|nr:hypothetical protein BKL86_14310 [Staphylococcus aureus]